MKPMLAETVPPGHKLIFPLYASPKLDGIRALCDMGDVLSRSLKKIRNSHVQRVLQDVRLHGLDGELIVGDPTAPDAFRKTSSGVTSADGTPAFTYWVFDIWSTPETRFIDRNKALLERAKDFHLNGWGDIKVLPQIMLYSQAELDRYEVGLLNQGYEGVMVRSIDGLYKHGRSTLSQGYLLKVKRFLDAEMLITGFEPKLHNTNVQTRDERGYAKRSSHKENMIPLDTLGNILGTDVKTGAKMSVGSGFSDELRDHIWKNRKKYLKGYLTYKHFPLGSKDAPRFAVFKAFRDKSDMS